MRSSLARKIAIQYLNEYKRGYYLNGGNIEERVHLEEPKGAYDENGNYYTHYKYFEVFSNGYIMFFEYNLYIGRGLNSFSIRQEHNSKPLVKQKAKYPTKRRRAGN